MKNILFSIIVPTFNRNDLLLICLNTILESKKHIYAEIEIIVSSDSFEDTLFLNNSFFDNEVLFVNGPGKGPAANRNNGAKYAKGDWLIFLDDDVMVDSLLLHTYLTAISANSNVEAFEGAIHPDDLKLLKLDMAECPVNTNGGCFWSANICIKKNLFFKVGGFDEQFAIAAQEDQDIYEKLKVYTRVPFLKKAFVTHPVRIVSLKTKIQSAKQSIRNWLKFQQKTKPLVSCFYIGYKSQILAFLDNIKKAKTKSSLYNMYIIIIFPFIVLSSKINKNV